MRRRMWLLGGRDRRGCDCRDRDQFDQFQRGLRLLHLVKDVSSGGTQALQPRSGTAVAASLTCDRLFYRACSPSSFVPFPSAPPGAPFAAASRCATSRCTWPTASCSTCASLNGEFVSQSGRTRRCSTIRVRTRCACGPRICSMDATSLTNLLQAGARDPATSPLSDVTRDDRERRAARRQASCRREWPCRSRMTAAVSAAAGRLDAAARDEAEGGGRSGQGPARSARPRRRPT